MTKQEIINQCCVCKKIRFDDDTWSASPVGYKDDTMNISHTYCPECFKIAMIEVKAFSKAKREYSK